MNKPNSSRWKQYLFLIAFVERSDSAGGEKTKVHCQEDLASQFIRNNKNVFAVSIHCVDCMPETLVMALGYKEAFFANYTAHDTVSDLLLCAKEKIYPKPHKTLEVSFASGKIKETRT